MCEKFIVSMKPRTKLLKFKQIFLNKIQFEDFQKNKDLS